MITVDVQSSIVITVTVNSSKEYENLKAVADILRAADKPSTGASDLAHGIADALSMQEKQ